MAAVTIPARWRARCHLTFAMHAFGELGDGILMAGAAGRWCEAFGMWRLFNIGMAGDAIETGMDRMLHSRDINKQRTRRCCRSRPATCRHGKRGNRRFQFARGSLRAK